MVNSVCLVSFRRISVIVLTLLFSLGSTAVAQEFLFPRLELPTIPMPRGMADAWLDTRDKLVNEGSQQWLANRNRIRDQLLSDAGIDLQTATSLLNTGEFLLDQSTGTLKILSGGLPAVKEVAYSRSRACFNKGPTACLQDIRNGSAAVSAAAACASGGGWSICQEAVRLGQLPPANADKYVNTVGKVMSDWERREPRGTPPIPPNRPVNNQPAGWVPSSTRTPSQSLRQVVYFPFPSYSTSMPVAVSQFEFGTTNNYGGWNIFSITDGRPLYFSVYVPTESRYHYFYSNGLRFFP